MRRAVLGTLLALGLAAYGGGGGCVTERAGKPRLQGGEGSARGPVGDFADTVRRRRRNVEGDH